MRKLFLLLFCVFPLFFGCGIPLLKKDPKYLDSKRKTSFDYFGTVCFAVVYDDFGSKTAASRFETAWQEIKEMLAGLENSVSVDKPGSDIYRFNEAKNGESVAISPATAEIMAEAIKIYEFTGGAFNPAVANLVDLWGFSPRFRKDTDKEMPYDRPRNEDGSFALPDRRYIDAFKRLSDFSEVKLGGDKKGGYTLTKTAKDIVIDGTTYSLKIDFGGIAKGYGADKAAAILKKHGYEYGYVNLGLSSMQLLKRNVSDEGAPSDNMWAVSVSNPNNKTKNYIDVFGKNTGVSTSGTYDVHYFVKGREYSHIIDARSGEPTESDIVSVTILGPNGAYDDALTTALCVMGEDKARDFMNTSLKDYSVAMIVRKGTELELVTNITSGGYSLNVSGE